MAHAWLDSLSEDWVSEPRSESSQVQISNPGSKPQISAREVVSKLPRPSQPGKKLHSTHEAASINLHALNERSCNDHNIPSARVSSKLSNEAQQLLSERGRHVSRSLSVSTDGSVVRHDTVQHKAQSASPVKGRAEIPEWKRRLLHGDMQYGESKDLFSSAATGLENMFRPPPARIPGIQEEEEEGDEEEEEEESVGEEIEYEKRRNVNDTTMPSSPPPYPRRVDTSELSEEQSSLVPETKATSPIRNIRYARNETDWDGSSRTDGSITERINDPHNVATRGVSGSVRVSMGVNQRRDPSRKISSKSVIHNEDFSPILITRRNAEDGRLSFAPVDLPADQLKKKLEHLQQSQLVLGSDSFSRLDEPNLNVNGGSQHLENTHEYAMQGGFLNLQRGGRSAEGSFRRRPLSPPLNTDSSEMLPESSLQASTPKRFPTVSTDRSTSGTVRVQSSTTLSPEMPKPPHPSPEKRLQVPQQANGLKLFGHYDTFTNQTLLRRISQFEDEMTASPSRSMNQTADESINPEPSAGIPRVYVAARKSSEESPSGSRFGSGEFDGYSFNGDITLNTADSSTLTNKENVPPEEGTLPPSQPFRFHVTQHPSFSSDDDLRVSRSRVKSNVTTSSSKHSAKQSTSRTIQQAEGSPSMVNSQQRLLATPKRDSSEGKRPRTSPLKDPTPKRRRTLHKSDVAYGMDEWPLELDHVLSSHHTMQIVMGRNGGNAHQDDTQKRANPAALALRQIHRSRSPTPKSTGKHERQPLNDLQFADEDYHTDSFAIDQDVQVQDFAAGASRKTSMQTQDFFEEANKIMAMIREKARPNGGLISVAESGVESGEQSRDYLSDSEDSYQDSYKEPFSRPPSRDGPPISRLPVRQENPEIADRLRQYEEGSDMGDLITHSMRSVGLAQEAIEEMNRASRSAEECLQNLEMRQSTATDPNEVISDMPNVRLSRNPEVSPYDEPDGFLTYGSRSSAASTNRSIPTGSSRGSESRKLIAPAVVSELIGNQVGNMVLDKGKNKWVRVKTPRPASRTRNALPSEDSEDDPFASIPDLSVDERKETENLGLCAAPAEVIHDKVQEVFSPAPSSHRDNSTGTKSMMSHTKETLAKIRQTLSETTVENDEEIEHEITIHEDRVQRSTPARRKNLTITFSSPIASIIQDVLPQHADSSRDEGAEAGGRSLGEIVIDSLKRPKNRSASSALHRGHTQVSRVLSMKRQDFLPRPVSRIEEREDEDSHDEASERQVTVRAESSMVESHDEERCHRSLSFVITTPASQKTRPLAATPIIGQHVGTLSLSPLSEFTINQADQSCGLELSYVVGNDYLVTGNRSRTVLSQSIRSLVEKITEVEPFEPDWDGLQVLDIKSKQLKSLHKLDDFCSSIVTLDASENLIAHLDGIPESVRNLRVTHNSLSELTAWGHLTNLQYVDISNNQINSLYAFKDLVHLRSLRADNNQITSLEGIKLHDSLQVLRVRGNLIDEVDFEGSKMEHLVELDLRGNQISSLRNLEQLPNLSSLNLEKNRLFSFGSTSGEAMPNLKSIKLSNNFLTNLDLTPFPATRLLHADHNKITQLQGFKHTRRLDSLSLREQCGSTPLSMSFLRHAYEVRKLFLSGNRLTTFALPADFLNLQYLELANCGLQDLSSNLGQLMPNIRTLNLNFNALDDLSPLRYIPRLKKLLAVGNRLENMAALAAFLSEFPHLATLDLRDNPMTLGFYPPIQALVRTTGSEFQEYDPFVLPDVDPERDQVFSGRVDMGTRKRRRFYELVLSRRCARLKCSDGLEVDREAVRKKDAVWQALVEAGDVRDAPPLPKEKEKETEER